jgi:hypothetical protein
VWGIFGYALSMPKLCSIADVIQFHGYSMTRGCAGGIFREHRVASGWSLSGQTVCSPIRPVQEFKVICNGDPARQPSHKASAEDHAGFAIANKSPHNRCHRCPRTSRSEPVCKLSVCDPSLAHNVPRDSGKGVDRFRKEAAPLQDLSPDLCLRTSE